MGTPRPVSGGRAGRRGWFSFPGASGPALDRTRPTISPKTPLCSSHPEMKTAHKPAWAALLGQPEVASRAPGAACGRAFVPSLGLGAAGYAARFPWWRRGKLCRRSVPPGMGWGVSAAARALQGLVPSSAQTHGPVPRAPVSPLPGPPSYLSGDHHPAPAPEGKHREGRGACARS